MDLKEFLSVCKMIQEVPVGEADSGHAAGFTYPIWPENVLGFPWKSWRMWLARKNFMLLCFACCHSDLNPDKRQNMKRWVVNRPDRLSRSDNTTAQCSSNLALFSSGRTYRPRQAETQLYFIQHGGTTVTPACPKHYCHAFWVT